MASDKSESEEQYLIRTKKIAPGHPDYLRTLRLSASHEVQLLVTTQPVFVA